MVNKITEQFNKNITKPLKYTFDITKTGLFFISVSARCRSGEQIGYRGGQDLRIEIDNQKLREIPPRDKPQYKDIPPTWNGTKLRGLKKTIVFLLRLEQGEHLLKFIPYQGAKIEEIVIQQIEGSQKVSFKPEEQAEDGDRRPWYTFALIDLPLKKIRAKATIQYHWWDSDDVKIIIDSKIQKQPKVILHRFWYWAGILAKKVFKKQLTTQSKFITDLSKGNHYIEFWADKTPLLHWVELELGEMPKYILKGKIVLHQDIEKTDFVNFRSSPKRPEKNKKSNVIAKLKNGDEVDILEKVVIGEWVPAKSYVWHKVKHNAQVGYILSTYVEIQGQEREKIIETIRKTARENQVDENILLAIAGRESHYKPYAASAPSDWKYENGKLMAARGIFQLTEGDEGHPGSIEQLKENKGEYYYVVEDLFNAEQNIIGGVKYYKYLLDKRYKGQDDWLRKIIVAWNAGEGNVPPGLDIDFSRIKKPTKRREAENFLNSVLRNYKIKNWYKILPVIILMIGLGLGFWYFNSVNLGAGRVLGEAVIDQVINSDTSEYNRWIDLIEIKDRKMIQDKEKMIFTGEYYYDFSKDGNKETVRITARDEGYWEPYLTLEYNDKVLNNDIYGFLMNVAIWPTTDDILVIQTLTGHTINNYFYTVHQNGEMYNISIIDKEGSTESIGSVGGMYVYDIRPFFARGILVYYRGYGLCNSLAEFYELRSDVDDYYKLLKAWDLEESDIHCSQPNIPGG